MNWTDLTLFTDASHQPFLWPGGQPAALLVHGFPGTPAELRPLAHTLHAAGWTTHGLLLPGFGPDIGTLFTRDWPEWVAAAAAAIAALAQQHQPLLLIGFSMGGAVLLNAVARHEAALPTAGLVLLAPFWQLGNRPQRAVYRLLKPLLRGIRPFKKADFADPRLRAGLGGFLPELDLDDTAVQAMLRDFRIPARVFDNLLGIGRAAWQAAPRAALPTLVLQGTADEVVRPAATRRLLQRLPGPLTYRELPAAHDLLQPDAPGWAAVVAAVGEYGRLLTN
ncbi:MAG: alpha/beta fold hydrolase [Anaerolineales bacterium]|nr:alpha/beta fold hydrolase [Anaerolineales bacterium]